MLRYTQEYFMNFQQGVHMSKFYKRPKVKAHIEQLPDGTVLYAHNGCMKMRWLIASTVPNMEFFVRPETDKYIANDITIEDFISLGWTTDYAIPPSTNTLTELALASSKIVFEAERAHETDVWLGDMEPAIREWLENAVQALQQQENVAPEND